MDKESIVKLIFKAIDELNDGTDVRFETNDGANTVLFGENSKLDSLSLVSLIASVEASVEDEVGIVVSLADERALSQKDNPFQTINSLADYVVLLLTEK